VPLTWLSKPDNSLLAPLLDKFNHLERDTGFWDTEELSNRVQLRYKPSGERTEHCPHILPPLKESEITPELLDKIDGLFVNMISGFDISIATLESALNKAKKRPYIHLDVHALVLGRLSISQEGGFGGGREPRGVNEWKRWLAIADSVQMNDFEIRWFADPQIKSEREFIEAVCQIEDGRSRHIIVTKAALGATMFDIHNRKVYHASPAPVIAIETTGSGDVFGAAFIFFMLAGQAAEAALQLAVKWATWNTTLTTIDQIIDSPQNTF
jgi:sugar/nucleoside kinase (ribokinase family)